MRRTNFAGGIRRAARRLALVGWGMIVLTPVARAEDAAADPWTALGKCDFAISDAYLTVENEVRQAPPAQHAALEQKLVAVIEKPDAPFAAKQFACRMLRVVGSDKCLPALERMLAADEKQAHMARYALEALPPGAADEVLRKALGRTTGNVRIGIVNSLAARGDRQSVPAMAALAADSDAATAGAALHALGRIGGQQAADALAGIKVSGALEAARADALLLCTDGLRAAGEKRAAAIVFRRIMDGNPPANLRAAALLGLARSDGGAAVLPLIVQAMKSNEREMQQAGAMAALEVSGAGVAAKLAAELPGLPPAGKIALLNVLAGRKDAAGLGAAVNPLAADPDPAVRLAAVRALASVGDASSVGMLAGLLKAGDETAQAAQQSLTALPGAGVAQALIKVAGSGDATVRIGAIDVLAERRETAAWDALVAAANGDEPKVRRAAIKALGTVAMAAQLPQLVELTVARKNAAEQDALAQALTTAAQRINDREARAAVVVRGMAGAGDEAKVALLSVLGKLGGNAARREIETQLASDAPDMKKAAVRALADWPDATPMAELLTLARQPAAAGNIDLLALRGYIRMIGLSGQAPKAQLELYRQSMELATRVEEKRLVLAGMAELKQIETLRLLGSYADNPAIKDEALAAGLDMAEKMVRARERKEIIAFLQRAAEQATDQNLRKRAGGLLKKYNK